LRDIGTKLDAEFFGLRIQRLRVSVRDDEVDALDTRVDHIRDGIAACTANTNHGDFWLQFINNRWSYIDAHG
jgi:hypothetical protein